MSVEFLILSFEFTRTDPQHVEGGVCANSKLKTQNSELERMRR